MGIDYTKRPSSAGLPPAPAGSASPPGSAAVPAPGSPPGAAAPVSLSKVTLTKAAPTVSLTKQGSAGGLLRVNLNWNAKPPAARGLFRKSAQLDLDLGCLYEFTDGTKGVVQALGNSFSAAPRGAKDRVIWLDGDDRSGTNTGGENLFVDLSQVAQIKRVLVFALIYEGAANWADAAGVATLFPAAGPQIEVHLDESRNGARICAIAMLQSENGDLSVRREVNYLDGAQRLLDQTYSWGMNWTAGRK